jgi:SpoVK/Ycf46/Vps4 family AAA+-type ATPase
MAKASDLRLGQAQSMLFKGPFGFGKTLAAASFALEGPVYLSYWDKKRPVELATYFTEARFGSKAKTILENIEYDVYSAANAGEYLNWLLDRVNDCRLHSYHQ